MKRTLVYRVPSATFHFTRGDNYVYLDFVDRNRSIKYKKTSKTGKMLIDRLKRRGVEKVTYPK